MRIIEDKAQQADKHLIKHRYWDKYNIEYLRYPLPVGDYILIDEKVQDVLDRKQARGIEIKKMDFVGTYSVCVDTKKDMQEIIGDICGKQHDRFRDECIFAQNNGVKLYILVENEGEYLDSKKTIWQPPVTCLEDVFKWRNKRAFIWKNGKQMYPTCTKGATLAKAMKSMELKYGVSFVFCTPQKSGRKVLELLIGEV